VPWPTQLVENPVELIDIVAPLPLPQHASWYVHNMLLIGNVATGNGLPSRQVGRSAGRQVRSPVP
jgi:hypothetical protein